MLNLQKREVTFFWFVEESCSSWLVPVLLSLLMAEDLSFLNFLSSFLYSRRRPELKDSEDFELEDVESESEIEDSDEGEERSEDEESDGGGEGGLFG